MARVLVVDDMDDVRRALTLLLRMYGHKVDEASGGAAALTALSTFAYDVVLLDLHMPDLDGLDVLQRSKAFVRLLRLFCSRLMRSHVSMLTHWYSVPQKPPSKTTYSSRLLTKWFVS